MRGLCAVTVALLHFDFGAGFLAKHGFLSVLSGFVISMRIGCNLEMVFGHSWAPAPRGFCRCSSLGTMGAIIGTSIAYLTHSLNYPGVNSA